MIALLLHLLFLPGALLADSGAPKTPGPGHESSRVIGKDSNGNQLDDSWEQKYFGDLSHSPTDDTDGDGETNAAEFAAGTDPTNRFDNANSRRNPGAGANFSYTLDAECDTSAGVYVTVSGQDFLVRTLWRAIHFPFGLHRASWDGLDDQGCRVATGDYKIKVLCSNMSYVWDGVIGNNSSTFTGIVIQAGTGYGVTDMCPSDDGSLVYAAFGFNEGTFDIRAFTAGNPNQAINCLEHSHHTAYALLAVDGNRMYAANIGDVDSDPAHTTFVRALNLPDFSAVKDYGQTVTYGAAGPRVAACLDVQTGARCIDANDAGNYWPAATGLAVQRGATGHLLAVAHGNSTQRKASNIFINAVARGQDQILLFNKANARSVGSISAFNPQKIAFAPNGDLWAIVARTKDGPPAAAVRFAAATLGATNVPSTTIADLSRPMAITVLADNSILVADAGTNETIRAYSPSGAYHPALSYGDPGGYKTNGPAVNDHCFQFGEEIGEKVPLSALPDGSFWVGDGGPGRGGTGRLLHISASRTSLPNISFLTSNSTVACDPNNPTRVFWDYLEFQVDYSQPLAPGTNRSWTLVKNWAAGLDKRFYPYGGNGFGLNTVVTLTKNNKTSTYGFIHDQGAKTNSVFELPADGPIRFTGQHKEQAYRPGLNYGLYANGDLRYSTWDKRSGIQQIFKSPLLSIDAANNPVWSSPVALAKTSMHRKDLSAGAGFFGSSTIQFPITGSGIVATFDSSQGPASSRGMRLGGSTLNGAGYVWKASPTVEADVPFDGMGSYDVGDGVTSYGGHKVMSIEPLNSADTSQHHLVYGYSGEFWNGTQANQFMHFFDDGLFVGQFGTPGKVQNEIGPSIAGFAGNSFCPSLVQNPSDGELYLYHNDESNHAGIHRWHLVGANAVYTYTGGVAAGAAPPSVTLAANPPDAAPGIPPAPTGLRVTSTSNGQTGLGWNAVSGATAYKIKVSNRKGGPYVTTLVSTPSATIKTANDFFSYVCVSAVDRSQAESRHSDEVKVLPLDPSVSVHPAGSLKYRHWEPGQLTATAKAGFRLDSQAAGKNGFAVQLPKTFDPLGTLLRTSVGSKGGVVFGNSGTTPVLANLEPGVSFELDPASKWAPQSHLKNSFSIDGQIGQQSGLHAENNGVCQVNIKVTEAARWHILTVFAPDIFEDNQAAAISLSPTGQETPGASFEISDRDAAPGVTGGFNRVLQYRFRGNVTLSYRQPPGTFSPPDDGHSLRNGNLQALFIDDEPEIAGP